jgi:peroxiredoxin
MRTLCLVGVIAGLAGAAMADVERGSEAPDFTVHRRVTLGDFKGQQPLLLVISATGCPWARAEMPQIQKLHEAGHDLGILVLNSERKMDAEGLAKWMADNEFTFPTAPDQELENAKAYGAKHTPTFYLIDKQGKIQFIHEGSGGDLPEAVMADAIELAKAGKVGRTEPATAKGKG